jgi:hypothetical protein
LRLLKLSAFLLTPLFTCLTGMSQQQAVQSDTFVDSVGVNIHLSYSPTLYGTNFPLVQSSLATLGVRHIRDAVSQWPSNSFYIVHHNALAAQGITGIFSTATDQTTTLLQAFPQQVASFEAYEYPNEPDAKYGFPGTVTGFESTLYTAAAGKYPVFGPALTKTASYATLGNQTAYLDGGNIHDYMAGRNPGTAGWGAVGCGGTHAYGSIPFSLDCVHMVSGTKPVWATETGYGNWTGQTNWVTEAVSATYMPRLLLEHWNAGIKRTYIYELMEEGTDGFQGYGLIRADGTQKPAFLAVSNLLTLLADKGAAFTPDPLAYSITGGDSTLHKLLLQKRDGTYYLALWVEQSSYNPDAHTPITVAPQAITLTGSHAFSGVTTYQWGVDGNVTTNAVATGTSLPLTVSDKLMIVKFTPDNTWALNVTASPAGAGTVTSEPASADWKFVNGQSVVLTAQPTAGYQFAGYTGGVTGYGASISVNGTSSTTVTANFTCTYALSASSVALAAGGSTQSVAYTAGSTCPVQPSVSASWAVATATNGMLSITAAANTGAPRTATVTLGTATTTITQATAAPITATLSTSLGTGWVSVDGKPYVSGTKLHWAAGSSHVMSGYSPQAVNNVVYLFNGWTSGLQGAVLQTINTPAVDTTYSIALVPGSYLNAYGATGGTVATSMDGVQYGSMMYYLPTAVVNVTAVPNTGCSFTSWSGASTSTDATLAVTMSSSTSLIAHFTCAN